MPEGYKAVGTIDEERLGVLDPARPGGGVACVPGGCEALKMREVFLLEDLRYKAHILASEDFVAVGCGDACALLTPMLEGIEAKKSNPCDIFAWGINPKDAAGFVEALQKQSPRCASGYGLE